MGELGSGAAAKMILQVVVCINMLGAYEAGSSLRNAVLILKLCKKFCRVSSGQSFVVDHWLERFKRPDDPLYRAAEADEVFLENWRRRSTPKTWTFRFPEHPGAGASMARHGHG